MSNFFQQLWKRRVIQFAGLYLGASWLLLQVAVALETTLELPNWTDQITLAFLALGFPLVLILAWAQDTKVKTDLAETTSQNTAASATKPRQSDTKISIAVLPFVNMSDDKSHEYFADGMTEDLLTALSLSQHLSVAARTSSFKYKGKSDDIRTIGHELGVDYIVEGSARPIGERIRITAQLIEAATGAHVWAEKYDRPQENLFDIQDEVVNNIVSALNISLSYGVGERLVGSKPKSLTHWQRVQQLSIRMSSGAMQDHRETVPLLEKIVKEDPDYAYATSMLAFAYFVRLVNGNSINPAEDFKRAVPLIEKGLALAPADPMNLYYCASAAGYSGQYERAIALAEKGLSINPNLLELYAPITQACTNLGQYEKADRALDTAKSMSLGLWQDAIIWYRAILRNAELRYAEALPLLEKTTQAFPEYLLPRIYMAIAQTGSGDHAGAAKTIKQAHAISPDLDLHSIKAMLSSYVYPVEGEAERRIALLITLWPGEVS